MKSIAKSRNKTSSSVRHRLRKSDMSVAVDARFACRVLLSDIEDKLLHCRVVSDCLCFVKQLEEAGATETTTENLPFLLWEMISQVVTLVEQATTKFLEMSPAPVDPAKWKDGQP